jgi:RNA polymerase sigma-70 factor (ECF subfamily)
MDSRRSDQSNIPDDEAQLVLLAKRDRDAFAMLYLRYVDRVHAYCSRRLGDGEEAADATSTTFTRALGSIGTCREDSFRSWLFSIAHNVLIDSYRIRHPMDSLDAAAQVHTLDPTPEDAALAGERTRAVSALLAQLSPDQRQVLELRLSGLTSKEIGIVLGKNPNAVDQAQYRAVQRLRSLSGAGRALLEGLR